MLELDKKVFGHITTKEVIGADPPLQGMRAMLEQELVILASQLGGLGPERLAELLKEQQARDARVNSRPGAMALAQGKIKLYNEYSKRYADIIAQRMAQRLGP